MENTNTTPKNKYPDNFVFPEKTLYECVKCGNCCNNYWMIPIDEESEKTIKDDPNLKQINFSQKYTEPFYDNPILKGQRCIRTKDSNCIFLDLQKICLVHKFLGYDKKPQHCKDYPFIYVKTPGGIYVTPDYSCYSIIRELGNPVSSYSEILKSDYEKSKMVFDVQEPIKLSPRIEIPWDVYLKIEKGLLDFLSVDVYTLDDRLIGGNVFLNLLEEFFVEASADPNNTPSLIVDAFISNIQKQNYARVIKIAQKPVFSNSIHRMFVGLFTSFRNEMRLDKKTLSTMIKIFKTYIKYSLRFGKIRLLPVAHDFGFGDFKEARFLKEEPYYAFQMLRYMRYLIESKQIIMNTSMLKGYNIILFLSAVIRWYCVGQCLERFIPDVEREDINKAIEWTEKYYGFRSLMFNLLDTYPVLSDTLNRLFDRKNYAATIVRGNKH